MQTKHILYVHARSRTCKRQKIAILKARSLESNVRAVLLNWQCVRWEMCASAK